MSVKYPETLAGAFMTLLFGPCNWPGWKDECDRLKKMGIKNNLQLAKIFKESYPEYSETRTRYYRWLKSVSPGTHIDPKFLGKVEEGHQSKEIVTVQQLYDAQLPANAQRPKETVKAQPSVLPENLSSTVKRKAPGPCQKLSKEECVSRKDECRWQIYKTGPRAGNGYCYTKASTINLASPDENRPISVADRLRLAAESSKSRSPHNPVQKRQQTITLVPESQSQSQFTQRLRQAIDRKLPPSPRIPYPPLPRIRSKPTPVKARIPDQDPVMRRGQSNQNPSTTRIQVLQDQDSSMKRGQNPATTRIQAQQDKRQDSSMKRGQNPAPTRTQARQDKRQDSSMKRGQNPAPRITLGQPDNFQFATDI